MSLSFTPWNYLKPNTEREVFEYLLEFKDKGRVVAGGTGIYEVAHRGLMAHIETLIDISQLGLSYIKAETNSPARNGYHDDHAIGVFRNSWLSHSDGARDALAAIQPPQVKNVATIGGSICTALPFFDLPVALLALDL